MCVGGMRKSLFLSVILLAWKANSYYITHAGGVDPRKDEYAHGCEFAFLCTESVVCP